MSSAARSARSASSGAARRAPLRHHGVADELVERAVVPEHALDHRVEELAERGRHLVGRLPGGVPREAAQVGEEHRHRAALASRARRLREAAMRSATGRAK
jgi:hypothetical protein